MDEHANKRGVSTALHRVAALASHEASVAAVVIAVAGWLIAWATLGEPEWMLTTLEVTAATVTLVMVFVIQHAQRRAEIVTQLKLDELVRASPRADGALVKAEADRDEELASRAEHNLRYRHEVGAADDRA
jgi:low affinity Fe/Cu permease